MEVLTYRAVEGESEVRTLCSANVPGEVGDWTETPRTAIVRAFVDGVADDGYGSPPDIVVADAFAWVVAPLAARIPKAFKRAPRAPNAWLKSTAPARKERARPAREAAAARAKQKRR
ncbi:MAG: hypothetical protein FJ104_17180 [Deltaproteobacteria bacterium]|nr:hypothetical protein [Deltaproteobacteria bacterium]